MKATMLQALIKKQARHAVAAIWDLGISFGFQVPGFGLLFLTAGLVSCAPKVEKPLPPPPPAAYQGPDWLRGSIGALATVDGYRPVVVSGYGLVVGLNDTGSGDCPAALRPFMLEMISKGGFGRSDTNTKGLSPERVLASKQTAVVRIEGVIPAGATRGTTFDLLVSALPESETSSLEDGVLYTTDLRVGGLDLGRPADTNLARGHGPVFLNPFAEKAGEITTERPPEQRIGTVLGGGVLEAEMPLQLLTNTRSFRLTRQIADRINTRFPPDASEPDPIADPKSDTVVSLRVPKRFAHNPQRLLDLASHLYLNPTLSFSQDRAHELVDLLQKPENRLQVDAIALTLEGLGSQAALPIIRDLYASPDPLVRITMLTVGAHLNDLRAVDPLLEIAALNSGAGSELAVRLLGELLAYKHENVRLARKLRELLDSNDPLVRIAAFDALSGANDESVRHFYFQNKLELDQVTCTKPMVYVTRAQRPRIVVFNEHLGFTKPPASPLLYTLWDNRFMLRSETDSADLAVFYHRPGAPKPKQVTIPSNVGYLGGVLAYTPNEDSKTPGFDLSYSRIVTALYQLTRDKVIDAPFLVERNDLADRIKRIGDIPIERPETDPNAPKPTPPPARPDTDLKPVTPAAAPAPIPAAK
jgi:hypothetical protein